MDNKWDRRDGKRARKARDRFKISEDLFSQQTRVRAKELAKLKKEWRREDTEDVEDYADDVYN